jgi:hypothetical protein
MRQYPGPQSWRASIIGARGLDKVKGVALLFALAHNLMRMMTLAPEMLGIRTGTPGIPERNELAKSAENGKKLTNASTKGATKCRMHSVRLTVALNRPTPTVHVGSKTS